MYEIYFLKIFHALKISPNKFHALKKRPKKFRALNTIAHPPLAGLYERSLT